MGYLVGYPHFGKCSAHAKCKTARLGSLGEKILTAVGSAQIGSPKLFGKLGTSAHQKMPKQPRSDFESWGVVKFWWFSVGIRRNNLEIHGTSWDHQKENSLFKYAPSIEG